MHKLLVNRLGGLSLSRKSVFRLTDRPDMTLDVYRGRKTTIQYNPLILHAKIQPKISSGSGEEFDFVIFAIFIRPSKTSRIMSCPLSIRPSFRLSVYFSCPLHNSDTVQDIFMKLGTNINHHQTMCREQEPTLHLHFLRNYAPLNFF